MGLSDQERYSKIVYTVKNLSDLLATITDEYGFRKLKSFQDKIWPALLNKEQFNHFWLFGDGFSNTKFEGGLLYEALSIHAEDLVGEPYEQTEEQNEKQGMREFILERMDILNLLSDRNERIVVEAYQHIINYFYAVNRYRDKFSENFTDLTSLLSNIKGELFKIISNDPTYFRAYLLSNIYKKCIDVYADDALNNVLRKHYLYHNFPLMKEHDTKFLFETWKRIQFKNTSELSFEERVFTVFECMNRRLGSFPHIASSIIKELETLVDVEKLKSILDKCRESYKLYKQDESERASENYKYCTLTDNYGR